MNQTLLAHIFGSLQTIEHAMGRAKKALADTSTERALVNDITEISRFVAEMRRTANRLNMELAQNRFTEADRSLQIFYGLLSLTKPEIMRIIGDKSSDRLEREAFREHAPQKPLSH